jgi:copper transport protein
MTGTRRRTGPARVAGATLFLLVATLALPALVGWRASAHAQLVASSPGAGEVVAESPSQLVLIFSEPLEEEFSSLDLADASGEIVASDLGSVNPEDEFQLVAELPPLADGVYQVRWQSLSTADGHTASGFFSFGVGEAGAVPAGSSGHEGFEPDAVVTVGRWLGYLGLLAGIGLPIVAWVVLRQPPRSLLIRLAGGLFLLSAVASLGLALKAAGEVDGGEIGTYLFGSRNGQLQVARAGVLALGGVAVLALAGAWPRVALWVSGGAALLGIGLLTAAGHASALPGISAIASQVVHVASAGVWLTGIVVLTGVALRPGMVTRQREPLVRCLPRFSAIALVSIGLVGVTGFFASWSQTGSLLDLGSDYGRVLLVKVLLAAAALGVGALNFLFGERLSGGLLGMRPRLAVEIGLALSVLLATGLLSATSPTDSARGVGLAPVPDAFGRVIPGMSMELLPGRTGVNQVAVSVDGAMASANLELVLDRLDTGGQTRIPLRHSGGGGAHMPDMPGMDHGPAAADPDAPARFVADAVVLPPGSRWDASVLLLSALDGTEVSRQRFSFELDESAVVRGAATSLVDIGLLTAGLLAAGGALSIGLGVGGTRLPRCDVVASRIALGAGGAVAAVLGVVIGVGRIGLLG